MATVTNNGLNGAVGNLVFYSMNGKQYARAKPKFTNTKRKALARSEQAIAFGQVSKGVSGLLGYLKNELGFPLTRNSYNAARSWISRMNSAAGKLAEWPLEARFTNACQLNKQADLRDYFSAGLSVTDAGDGSIRIGLDALDPLLHIRAPKGCSNIVIRFFSFAPLFGNQNEMPLQQASLEIAYRAGKLPAWETVLNTGAGKGEIAVVVMAVQFIMPDARGRTNNGLYLPAAIVSMGRLQRYHPGWMGRMKKGTGD